MEGLHDTSCILPFILFEGIGKSFSFNSILDFDIRF